MLSQLLIPSRPGRAKRYEKNKNQRKKILFFYLKKSLKKNMPNPAANLGPAN
jgi:hypothetical protein